MLNCQDAEEEGIETAGDLRRRAAEAAAGAVEPQDLWDLAPELSYEIELSWASQGGAGCFGCHSGPMFNKKPDDPDVAGGMSPFGLFPFGGLFEQLFTQAGMTRSYVYDEARGRWVDVTDAIPETPPRPDEGNEPPVATASTPPPRPQTERRTPGVEEGVGRGVLREESPQVDGRGLAGRHQVLLGGHAERVLHDLRVVSGPRIGLPSGVGLGQGTTDLTIRRHEASFRKLTKEMIDSRCEQLWEEGQAAALGEPKPSSADHPRISRLIVGTTS